MVIAIPLSPLSTFINALFRRIRYRFRNLSLAPEGHTVKYLVVSPLFFTFLPISFQTLLIVPLYAITSPQPTGKRRSHLLSLDRIWTNVEDCLQSPYRTSLLHTPSPIVKQNEKVAHF